MRVTLATTVAAMALAGCAVQPGPSSPGWSLPTAAATTPSADEARSAAATEQLPTHSNLCDTGQLVPGGLAHVKRDTITHTGPGPHYEPTGAAVADGPTRTAPTEPYRVLAGDRVVIEHGPLRIGDTDWFLVHSAEERGVVSVGAIVPASAAWVPAREGEARLFEPITGTVAHCVFAAAGGPGRSALNVPPDQCSSGGLCRAGALGWVAAAPPGESCRLLVTDADSQEVVIEADVIEWSSGALWSRGRETRLTVDTDCIWSLRTAET